MMTATPLARAVTAFVAATGTLFLASASSSSVAAQVQQVPGTPSGGKEFVTFSYSPTRSWALFAACDDDSDDRLGILEADETIGVEAVGDRDAFRATFGRLDDDKDGFLQWVEFDRHYRQLVSSRDPFRLMLMREPVEPFDPSAPPTPASPEVALVATKDRDHDGALSDAEFRVFLLAADLSTNPTFGQIDVDASGAISPAELAPVIPLIRDGGSSLLQAYLNDPNLLPPYYIRGDEDNSGTLDQEELRQSLIAIDPTLQRWSSTILANADLSNNGILDRRELERADRR